MKKLISLIIMLSLMVALCSCGGYVNSYKAVGLVRSQTSDSCKASFLSLEGQLVFKLKNKNTEATEGDISYSIQVDEGEIRLYYDTYGVKEELATVGAGDSVDARGGYVEGGKSVYIIIEASEKTKGRISVYLNK